MEILIILFLVVAILISHLTSKQAIKNKVTSIIQSYGEKPKQELENLKGIRVFWEEYGDLLPDDEKIDSVTWDDLDMDTVFGRINICCSFVGEQYLYSCLHTLPKENAYNSGLERKIKLLTKGKDERVETQMLLSQIGKSDLGYYVPMFVNNLDNYKIERIEGYRFMQVLLILSVLPALIFMNPIYLAGTLMVFIINLGIYTMKKMKYEIYLNSFFNIINLVKTGKKISRLKHIKGQSEFEELDKCLLHLEKLCHFIAGAQKKKAASFSGDIFAMIYDYIIGATLWDFIIYDKICKILEDRKEEFLNLYKIIGEIDAAISIDSFRKSLPKYCLPEFTDNNEMMVTDIYHPLIDEPIYNTFRMDKSCLITGSNASGKSTFIKAVTINLLLAQCINTCMAETAKLPRAWVLTSMAVRDDLMKGESYFIKEIKYLNRIIESLKSDRFLFCVIDEILKGTNTEERIAASFSILEYISKKNCLALVATHDKELTVLLHEVYENYHFEEQINDNDIVFDYQVRQGPATSKNAIKLLEYVGFPEEIIVKAKEGCEGGLSTPG